MFKELKNKDWDMTRAQRRRRLIREERDFFLDFVLAVNLKLEMLVFI